MWHFGNSRNISFATVYSRSCRISDTFSDCYKPHNQAIYDTSATAGISRLKPYIPVPAVLLHTFSDCHKPHNKAIYGTSATAGTSRLKPYNPVPAVFLLAFSDCHKPHNKAKCGIFPCRCKNGRHILSVPAVLFFINITLSNRIVKPNTRYTRQPASHDFLFYSASDKSYAITATNRIAMRFAVRSAPPLSYPADSTDNSKGGT